MNFRKKLIVAALIAGGLVALAVAPALGDDDRVEVCHIPSGDLANAHTIKIGSSAVQTHLDHGDTLGACRIGY